MTSTLITNIGLLVSGDPDIAPLRDTALLIEDRQIIEVGTEQSSADRIIDAGGQSVMPGLIDGHVHPTVGEWTPAQNSTGWVRNYLHGGTTSMVSAGELHIPGLPFEDLTPRLVTGLATLARRTIGEYRPSGVKVHAGTLLLVPGLTAGDFDHLAEEGISQLKFIFYDWSRLEDGEAQQYVSWAHERGMTVKMHSGGVSRSGSSRVAGHELVTAVAPDVIAHISGGPIPMPDEEIVATIRDLPQATVEVCSSMNYRATQVTIDELVASTQLHRLTLGTDTPGGTGVIPRGMLRNICYLASVCGLSPELAVAAATGNVARRHRIPGGVLAAGQPADLLILGPIMGSRAQDVLECFSLGDLPGITLVMVDGEVLVEGRSEQTPPPKITATVRR
ncbi:amidohydrolase family protein [Nocardioides sp. AE5]|uniref:amidohydrolase family protein n=1 Tax=Nocardioides sp. AE5 TaxID=2962573 RepID=UPI002882B945|nr:amidohydrolase family protein [Nocardioides sp. AE5]MDT0202484.1 amidohydrolase family protein [Nocardioides sp. AE5]